MKMDNRTESFEPLRFDNRFLQALPGDPEPENRVRQVEGACYSLVQPKPAARPHTLAWSAEVASLLDLSEQFCRSEQFARVFSGTTQLAGMQPYAMAYGGHQFGNWAGQLGDGRAINLGEVLTRTGARWTLQLKGAGPTPYARRGDGLAVLRSSVREFLCSEAMHHLGVPTTRALSLVATGEQVERDMFYDGNPQLEPGAVVCRVAPSFLRFGSYQLHAWRGETELLRRLVDYTINTDFPHLGNPSSEVYLEWFNEVCRSTAELMIHWMRVGFVHGVMNSDNMSILGLTIDYGPYGWLEGYDPLWTPNTTDAQGRRYCFGRQPQIALWNLTRLAEALAPLLDAPELLEQGLQLYVDVYQHGWPRMMASKLGLERFDPADDSALLEELEQVLQLTETDMTIFYRRLGELPTKTDVSDAELLDTLREAFYRPADLSGAKAQRLVGWLRDYLARARHEEVSDVERAARMNRVNPNYVLRNYLAQQAIEAAEQGDAGMISELLELLRDPYAEQPGKERFAEKRPDWARNKAGCSMLSCSS